MNNYVKFLSIALITSSFCAHAFENVAFYVACAKETGNSDKSIEIGLTNAAGAERIVTLTPGQYMIVSLSRQVRTVTYYTPRPILAHDPSIELPKLPAVIFPVNQNTQDKVIRYEFDAASPTTRVQDGHVVVDGPNFKLGEQTQEELRAEFADYQRVR